MAGHGQIPLMSVLRIFLLGTYYLFMVEGFLVARQPVASVRLSPLHVTHEVIEDDSTNRWIRPIQGDRNSHSGNNRRILRKMTLPKLAQRLDEDLSETQWFVTGNVIPQYFTDDFLHGDPKIRLSTLEEYAWAVRNFFDQDECKAEIVATEVNSDRFNTITCTWRASGKINVLWGLHLKGFLVYTDFSIDEKTGKIQHQQDHLSLPVWDLVLSAMFPFLNGIVTAPEAPPAVPRIAAKSKNKVLPSEAWKSRADIFSYFVPPPSVDLHKKNPQSHLSTASFSSHSDGLQRKRDAHDSVERASEEAVDPGAVVPYSKARNQQIPSVQASRTHKVTKEEFAKILQEDLPHPLLTEIIEFLEETNQNSNHHWPRHDGGKSSPRNNKRENRRRPKIRAILEDGTKIPSIRAPTLMDRAKLYIVPDRAETRASLNEATRRATVRRASRYYFVEGSEEDQENLADHLQQI